MYAVNKQERRDLYQWPERQAAADQRRHADATYKRLHDNPDPPTSTPATP